MSYMDYVHLFDCKQPEIAMSIATCWWTECAENGMYGICGWSGWDRL